LLECRKHATPRKELRCRSRGLQTTKRARTPQQPPQQRVIHHLGLVLPFKILLAYRETPKRHQRTPMTERKFFTRTPSPSPHDERTSSPVSPAITNVA